MGVGTDSSASATRSGKAKHDLPAINPACDTDVGLTSLGSHVVSLPGIPHEAHNGANVDDAALPAGSSRVR